MKHTVVCVAQASFQLTPLAAGLEVWNRWAAPLAEIVGWSLFEIQKEELMSKGFFVLSSAQQRKDKKLYTVASHDRKTVFTLQELKRCSLATVGTVVFW